MRLNSEDCLVSEVISFIPNNFMNKNVNEGFMHLIFRNVFEEKTCRKGDPAKKEPDFIFNGIPIECTLASNKCKNKRKMNFINKIRLGRYTTSNTESDAIEYVRYQIEEKSKKEYSMENIHLCVLCLIERFDWVSDIYGSYTHFLTDYKREQFFNEIKNKYIKSNVFTNIFIVVPDRLATWHFWDVKTDKKISLSVTPYMINSKKYPFFMDKRLYNEWVRHKLIYKFAV